MGSKKKKRVSLISRQDKVSNRASMFGCNFQNISKYNFTFKQDKKVSKGKVCIKFAGKANVSNVKVHTDPEHGEGLVGKEGEEQRGRTGLEGWWCVFFENKREKKRMEETFF